MNGATPGSAARRGPAWWRLPLLALGVVALAFGVGAGLARLGVEMPLRAAAAAGHHGPLMVGGFFGVVIALERAVALGGLWAYGAPLLAGAGALALVAGQPAVAALLLPAAGGLLTAATLAAWRRQPAPFIAVMAAGAACWAVGNGLWAAGRDMAAVVPWWLGFFVLTIAGERLELSRLVPTTPAARRLFSALMWVLGGALLAGLPEPPPPAAAQVLGVALVGLAAWGLRHDVARRTVRGRSLPRFVAVCLLSGYGWLAIGGAVMAAAGLQQGSAAYDAALHAVLLGFVFSMVFGHAPVIFPAVLRVPVPWHPAMYAPLALLHGSLALRMAADALAAPGLLHAAGWGSALALAAFFVTLLARVLGATVIVRLRHSGNS